MKLEKDDLDAIAAAVIAGLKAEGIGATAPATTKTGGKAGTKDKPADAPKTEEAPKGPTDEEVKKARAALLEKLKATGEKIGKDAAKALVANYADGFANVQYADFAKLEADLEAAANEGAGAAGDDY
jgi:hypothetical protein